jgi:hypothetical protein
MSDYIYETLSNTGRGWTSAIVYDSYPNYVSPDYKMTLSGSAYEEFQKAMEEYANYQWQKKLSLNKNVKVI